METYKALYRRDGRAWVVQFDQLELSTWARSLTKAQRYAREALAVNLDYDSVEELEKAVIIEDHVADLPDAINRLCLERREYAFKRTDLELRTAIAAFHLIEDHAMSIRDAAAVLGVSHARVSQIVSGKGKPRTQIAAMKMAQ